MKFREAVCIGSVALLTCAIRTNPKKSHPVQAATHHAVSQIVLSEPNPLELEANEFGLPPDASLEDVESAFLDRAERQDAAGRLALGLHGYFHERLEMELRKLPEPTGDEEGDLSPEDIANYRESGWPATEDEQDEWFGNQARLLGLSPPVLPDDFFRAYLANVELDRALQLLDDPLGYFPDLSPPP